METSDRKKHWETIYRTRKLPAVSWFQPTPETSLYFLKKFRVPKTAKIIDIGGGGSFFADCLLDSGYRDITVLDISETALLQTKQRLGSRAGNIKWIVADISHFTPPGKYDVWHDRATFHFLTTVEEIDQYLHSAQKCLEPNGLLVLGTFSKEGPDKCSGLQVRQYSEDSLAHRLSGLFKKIACFTVDHITPLNTIQNFVFCSFRKLPRMEEKDKSESSVSVTNPSKQ